MSLDQGVARLVVGGGVVPGRVIGSCRGCCWLLVLGVEFEFRGEGAVQSVGVDPFLASHFQWVLRVPGWMLHAVPPVVRASGLFEDGYLVEERGGE